MKRPKIWGVMGFLGILSLILNGLLWAVPATAADEAQPVSKISSRLSLRIQMKLHWLEQNSSLLTGESQTPQPDILMDGAASNPNSEKVFLHFTDEPASGQVSDLASEGITLYPDSWIPSVGVFKTGFLLADLPVDKLGATAARDYILKIDTAEARSFPQNDLARTVMNVGPVWSGGDNGLGVTVAVLDSGIDASNPDIPALDLTNSRDYSKYPTLDDTITNHVTGHGTHVTGSVLGRGANSARYTGVAPGANLVFLKIGNDISSGATGAAIEAAIKAAADVYHANIITMSYGGLSPHHDGTDEMCQAVDYAVSRGVTVFMSAGNNASLGWHYSGTVPANSSSDFIQVKVAEAGENNTKLYFNLVWFDGLALNNHLSLQYYDSSLNPLGSVLTGTQSESLRGTEDVYSQYDNYLPAGDSTYYLKVQNTSSNPQFFHIYNNWYSRHIAFSSPDANYTLGSPAEADGAIAVGAYVTRTDWQDYQGNSWTNSAQTEENIATFSSRGPRVDIDSPVKPEIVAPGSVIISARDNDVYPCPSYNTGADIYPYGKYIVDNDGLQLDGSGPADYLVMQGTSMACPLAAGVGALLLGKNGWLTPAQVKASLQNTAVDLGAPGIDNTYGWGLINAGAAVNYYPDRHLRVAGGEIMPVDKSPLFFKWLAICSFLLGVALFSGIRFFQHLRRRLA